HRVLPFLAGPEDQKPGEWGCTEASLDRPTSLPAVTIAGMTPIPPRVLDEDLAELHMSQPFPRVKHHNLALAATDVAGAESEFCARDTEVMCADHASHDKLIADLTKRIARIAASTALTPAARTAVNHVRDDLARGALPVVWFRESMR